MWMTEPTKTCLVVGNSRVFRNVAREILEDLEFAVVEASRSGPAIEACRMQLPDCVLVEWDFPEPDERELLKGLRGIPGGENIPVHVADDLGAALDLILAEETEPSVGSWLH